MILNSLVSFEGRLQLVEVEIELTPGLPQMHFLGLPDQGIKESMDRIKCALRRQGFDYPRTQQILVNLRPAHFRKSSRGLELAVAAGLLAETEQIRWPKEYQDLIVYGELSLSGEVHEPEDLDRFHGHDAKTFLTGTGQELNRFEKFYVRTLEELKNPKFKFHEKTENSWQRPALDKNIFWSGAQAEWLKLMAVGGHSSLIAGAAGIGKTTLAQSLNFLMPPPAPNWPSVYEQFFEAPDWRPQIRPHHSISSQGLLGGSVPLTPGEITRAHGGVLILDELLEFAPEALEALREPLEEGVIRLRKRNLRQEFPADFQMIATTNLCKCGDWLPGRQRNCHFSVNQCLSTLRRVTGPFLDRFQTIYFLTKPANARIGAQEILDQILPVYEFQKRVGRKVRNARLPEEEFNLESENLKILHSLAEESPRRRLSTLRVARTFADLEFSEVIRSEHIELARKWTLKPFLDLKKGAS